MSNILDGTGAQFIPEHILHMVVHGWQLAIVVEMGQLRFDPSLRQHYTSGEALLILAHRLVDQSAWPTVALAIGGCLALNAWIFRDDSFVDWNGSFLERLVAAGCLRVRLLLIVRLDRIGIESLHGYVVVDLLVYDSGPIAGSECFAWQIDDVCDSSCNG